METITVDIDRQRNLEKLRLLTELRRRKCLNSFYDFCIDAFKVTNPEDEFIPNWHIKVICDELQKITTRVGKRELKPIMEGNLIINVPPRSLKSLIVSVYWNAWAWIKYPYIKFIVSSYSGELSKDHSVKTKALINSQWYKTNFGGSYGFTKEQNTKEYFVNTRKGFRQAASTGGTVTGKGGDIIVVDDPTNPKEAASDAERKIANDFFDHTLNSRLDNPAVGVFVIIMQRLHEDDLTGHLLERQTGQFRHLCIPAELSENVKPRELASKYIDNLYFPQRHGKVFLDMQRIALGENWFEGQYNQSPVSAGGNIVDKDWFGEFELHELPRKIRWDMAADTAYTEKTINDPSALIVFGIYKKNLYIRAVSEVFLTFPKLLQYIKRFANLNGFGWNSKIYIEPKASGKSIVQALRYDSGFNVIEDEPPSKDKVTRLQAVAPIVEGGRVFLLKGAGWRDKFLHQVSVFPNSKHDDIVDALTIVLNKTKLKTSGGARYKFTG